MVSLRVSHIGFVDRYKSTFAHPPGTEAPPLSPMERNFDAACLWPEGVGAAGEPRFSLHPAIADFMLVHPLIPRPQPPTQTSPQTVP